MESRYEGRWEEEQFRSKEIDGIQIDEAGVGRAQPLVRHARSRALRRIKLSMIHTYHLYNK